MDGVSGYFLSFFEFLLRRGLWGKDQAHIPYSLPMGETKVADRKDRIRLSGLSRGKTMS